MKKQVIVSCLAIGMLLSACNSENAFHENALTESSVDVSEQKIVSGNPSLDTVRKVIRKADIKCRVDNVEDAVFSLEHFTTTQGGMIVESHTENVITQTNSEEYKADSLRNAQIYAPKSTLTLRIPVERLDTFTRYLADMAMFTEHRNIDNIDVTLNYLANTKKNEATRESVSVLDKQLSQKNIEHTIKYRDGHAMSSIDREINNLSILDDVKYSTVTVELYQPWLVSLYTSQNPDAIIAKSFGEKAIDSLAWSIDLIESTILFLIAVWPLILGVGFVLFWYRRSARRQKYAA